MTSKHIIEAAHAARNAYYNGSISAWEFIFLLPENKEKWYRVAEAILATPAAAAEPIAYNVQGAINTLWNSQLFSISDMKAFEARLRATPVAAAERIPSSNESAQFWLAAARSNYMGGYEDAMWDDLLKFFRALTGTRQGQRNCRLQQRLSQRSKALR